jgi:hypothetical protein
VPKLAVFYLLCGLSLLGCKTSHLTINSSQSKRGDALFGLIVPNNNYAKTPDLHIYAWTQSGDLNVTRSAIDFDLTSIPANANIIEAYLLLKFNTTSAYDKIIPGEGNQGSDSIVVQRIVSDWNENTVTWKTQPATTGINQIIIPRAKSCCNDYSINVTDLLNDMLKDPNNSFGFMIKYKREQPYNVAFFASKDHPNEGLHPQLIISYKRK